MRPQDRGTVDREPLNGPKIPLVVRMLGRLWLLAIFAYLAWISVEFGLLPRLHDYEVAPKCTTDTECYDREEP